MSNLFTDEETKEQLALERSWISQLLKSFIELIYEIPQDGEGTYISDVVQDTDRKVRV